MFGRFCQVVALGTKLLSTTAGLFFCYSSVLWTKYGLLKADTALFFVNSAGALMSINYVIIFYIFTTSRVRIVMVYAIFVCYFLIIYHYS